MINHSLKINYKRSAFPYISVGYDKPQTLECRARTQLTEVHSPDGDRTQLDIGVLISEQEHSQLMPRVKTTSQQFLEFTQLLSFSISDSPLTSFD